MMLAFVLGLLAVLVCCAPQAAEAKTALVTGGGSGIGKALALQLAAGGTETIIVGRREGPLSEVSKSNSMIRYCVGNIATALGRAALKKSCIKDSSLHILVHNAAMMPFDFLTSVGLKDFQAAMAANVEAPIFLTQELMPNLKAAGESARILMVSSGAADLAVPGLATYTVTKAALKMVWKQLAQQMADQGVHVGYCLPGLVRTAMPDAMTKKADFPLQGIIADRMRSGDVHEVEEVGEWMAKLFDTELVNNTLFREQEHNIDMPGHELGMKIKVTTEGKLLGKPAKDEL